MNLATFTAHPNTFLRTYCFPSDISTITQLFSTAASICCLCMRVYALCFWAHVCFWLFGLRGESGYMGVRSQFQTWLHLHNIAPANTNTEWIAVKGDEVLGGSKAVIYFSRSETRVKTIESINQRQWILSNPLSHLTGPVIGRSYRIPIPSASASSVCSKHMHPQKLVTCTVQDASFTQPFLPVRWTSLISRAN